MSTDSQHDLGNCSAAMTILRELREEFDNAIRIATKLDEKVGTKKLLKGIEGLNVIRDKFLVITEHGQRQAQIERICELVADDLNVAPEELRTALDRLWASVSPHPQMFQEVTELRNQLEDLQKLRDVMNQAKSLAPLGDLEPKLREVMQRPAMQKIDKAIEIIRKMQNLPGETASLEDLLKQCKEYGLQIPEDSEVRLRKAVANIDLIHDFMGTLERIRDLNERLLENVNPTEFQKFALRLQELRELNSELAKVSDIQNLEADMQVIYRRLCGQ